MSNLYKNINYNAPIDYLISSYVREYDISKANINILYSAGAITENEYNRYYTMDSSDRYIHIGLLQKGDPRITKLLQEGILEAKRKIFEANDIQNHEVLSIKNDAIFIINKELPYIKFDNIEFKYKNLYTSFYRLNRIEFYYYYDMVYKKEQMDVKGISDMNITLHENYFIDFLLSLFESAQMDSIENTISLLKNFYLDYINLRLDINYYRRLDSSSIYDIRAISRYADFNADFLPQSAINQIDISYNLNILIQLEKIYSNVYFNKRKGR